MLSPSLSSSPTLNDISSPYDPIKQAFSPVSEPTVTPHNYLIKRFSAFNRGARIFDIGLDNGEESRLIADQSPTFNPFRSSKGKNDTLSRLGLTEAAFFMEGVRRGYIMWQGAGPAGTGVSSQQLMRAKCEGHWNKVSRYLEIGGQGRTTTMFKAKETPFLRTDRTFEDFCGNIYQWRRNGKGRMQCLRSDGVLIATFHKRKYSFPGEGTVALLQPVSISSLHLLLSTCYVKWRKDERKKRY